jgi:hypothetical protein
MKTSTITAQKIAADLADQMQTIANRLNNALNNLNEAQPGYPTKASGAPPGSTTSEDNETYTSTERAALTPDTARTSHKRIHELINQLRNPTIELYSLIHKWAYEIHTEEPDTTTNTQWCNSCLRLQRCEPRYRNTLCWFCHDMRTTHHRLPSLELLERHHRGERITTKQREQDKPKHTKKR